MHTEAIMTPMPDGLSQQQVCVMAVETEPSFCVLCRMSCAVFAHYKTEGENQVGSNASMLTPLSWFCF